MWFCMWRMNGRGGCEEPSHKSSVCCRGYSICVECVVRNQKLIGIPDHLCTKPLTEALHGNPIFHIVTDARAVIARKLREQELSAALLSPLEYARESSDYRIVPDAAVVSAQGNGALLVRFREGVRNIAALAVDPNFAAEIVLARIILSEQFDVEPAIHPMIAPVDVMLQKADAALIAGDEAFRHGRESENVIDLVEEWREMTGLPFVHAFWCGREGDLSAEHIGALQHAGVQGAAAIDELVRPFAADLRDAARRYLASFSYTLTHDAKAGLGEFMKYLYYHGILPDVAELNFHAGDEEENTGLLSDPSPN